MCCKQISGAQWLAVPSISPINQICGLLKLQSSYIKLPVNLLTYHCFLCFALALMTDFKSSFHLVPSRICKLPLLAFQVFQFSFNCQNWSAYICYTRYTPHVYMMMLHDKGNFGQKWHDTVFLVMLGFKFANRPPPPSPTKLGPWHKLVTKSENEEIISKYYLICVTEFYALFNFTEVMQDLICEQRCNHFSAITIQWNLTIKTTYGTSWNGLNIEVVLFLNHFFSRTQIYHYKIGEIQYLRTCYWTKMTG